LLRKAADGKLKTPKAKEIRRRNIVDSLPPEKPAFRPRGDRPAAGPKDYKPKRAFGTDRPARSGSGPARFDSGPAKFGPGRPAESSALVRRGRRTNDLRGQRRDSMLDQQVKGVRRRARLMATGLRLGAASAEGRRTEPSERSLEAPDLSGQACRTIVPGETSLEEAGVR